MKKWLHFRYQAKGIELVNGTDDGKFRSILSRIFKKLNAKESQVFSELEQSKLESILSFGQQQVKGLLEILKYLAQECLDKLLKPNKLGEELKKISLQDNKINIFLQVYNEFVEKVDGNNEIDDVNWKIKVHINQDTKTHLKEPIAQLDLKLTNENISLDFNHEELSLFYNQLEGIQNQLDALLK